MGKFISLGEYDKLYKYIWIYLEVRFLIGFIFLNRFVFDQLKNEAMNIPRSPFISSLFYYIGFIIISLIIRAIQKHIDKKYPDENLTDEKKLLFEKANKIARYGTEKHSDYFLYINLFFVVILDILEEVFSKFYFSLFDFWMFEMLLFEIFDSKIFKTKIYIHHIISLIFVLLSCSLLKIISIILNFLNDTEDTKIFKSIKWLIPLGIIFSLLAQILRAFSYNMEKYYLVNRFISIPNYLVLYGLIGIVVSLICSLISTFIPCKDKNTSELSNYICDNENDKIFYFDSFIVYFKELASSYLGLRIILIILESILYYISNYYILTIYKTLAPIYHICIRRIYNLILVILRLINDLINHKEKDISLNILEFLMVLFFLLGSIIYLEFVELKFCNLDFYTKRGIKERSIDDKKFSLEDINSDCLTENSENGF